MSSDSVASTRIKFKPPTKEQECLHSYLHDAVVLIEEKQAWLERHRSFQGEILRRMQENLSEIIIDLFRSEDRSGEYFEEVAKIVARDLYYTRPLIWTNTILRSFGFSNEAEFCKWVGPYETELKCFRCMKAVDVDSRSRQEIVRKQYIHKLADESTNAPMRNGPLCLACFFSDIYLIRVQKNSSDRRAEPLKSIPYRKYLTSEHWDDIRTRAYERARYRCQVCNGQESLNAHHRTYDRVGQERDDDITVLCAECHGLFHGHGKLKD